MSGSAFSSMTRRCVWVTAMLLAVACWQSGREASGEDPAWRIDLPAPTVAEQVEANRDRVIAAQFSPTGRYLVIGLESGRIAVWNWQAQPWGRSLAAHQRPVTLLAFGAEDDRLLSGSQDLQVKYWDLNAGREWLSFEGAPLKAIYEIALSTNGRFAVSRGFDGFGVVWDLRVDRKRSDLFSYGFALAPNEGFLVSTPLRQPGVQVHSLVDATEPRQLLPGQQVSRVAVDPTSTTIACAVMTDPAPVVKLIDAKSGEERGSIVIPNPPGAAAAEPVGDLAFSSDGRWLLVASGSGRILRADVDAERILDEYRMSTDDEVLQARFVGSQNRYVVAAARDDEFRWQTACWETSSRQRLWAVPGEVTLDMRRQFGAWITTEGDIVFFDTTDGKSLRRLRPFLGGGKWAEQRP